MNNVPVKNVRNVVLVGHAASGKTSIAEALLNVAGMTTRLGSVPDKNTVSDCTHEEQERQVSVYATNLFLRHNDHNIFLSDTPGYADFLGQVIANVKVADAAIVVIDAVHGIEVGTRQIWKLLEANAIPRMIVLNKLDKENARFAELVNELAESFGNGCVPVMIPNGTDQHFSAVTEIIGGKGAVADPELYETYRTKVVEAVAETDEALMEKYFAEETLAEEELINGLRKGINATQLFPIAVSGATKSLGIEELLKCVLAYLPSPEDRGEKGVEDGEGLKPDPALPAAAHVFKTVTDPFVGQLTFFRVYQGTISSSSEVMNITREHKERFGELMIIQGKEQIAVDKATPGDIVAIAKLKYTSINDTLGSAKVTFKTIEFPNPVMTLALQTAKQGDEEKLWEGLSRLSHEDPTLQVERNPETHQLLASGLGDVHLDVIFKILKEKFKVDVVTSTPKVAYHETLRGTADVRYRYKKQSGGAGQFAEIAIRVRPNERDKGYEFVNKIVGGVISNQFIPSVDKGIHACMKDGVIAGCQVVDIVVELYDGKEHPVDSKDIAFQIAGKHAISQAIEKANPILLEPIMHVDITCPQEYMGDINGIINSKRGQIMGMDIQGTMQVIKALVPQAEMFRFCSELRSITGGRGSFSMELSHYNEVPPNIMQQVAEAYRKSKKKEED